MHPHIRTKNIEIVPKVDVALINAAEVIVSEPAFTSLVRLYTLNLSFSVVVPVLADLLERYLDVPTQPLQWYLARLGILTDTVEHQEVQILDVDVTIVSQVQRPIE